MATEYTQTKHVIVYTILYTITQLGLCMPANTHTGARGPQGHIHL